MITHGTLVLRLQDDYLTHLNREALSTRYPPEGSLCIVVSSPRERDLSDQLRMQTPGHISLKKAVDVLYEGKVYYDCELRSFKEVKGGSRADLQDI